MTLRDLISDLYLAIQQNVSDDTVIDDRLLAHFIHKQRALWIRNELNNGRTVDSNITQEYTAAITAATLPEVDGIPEGYTVYKTSTTLPRTIELHYRPAIEHVTPIYSNSDYSYKIKPFKVVDFSTAQYVGNGKFSKGKIFAYPENELLYILIPDEGFYEAFTSIKIKGIFENPEEVSGYVFETSKYPLSLHMWNYIKGTILNEDLRQFYVSNEDPINNSSNDLKNSNGQEK